MKTLDKCINEIKNIVENTEDSIIQLRLSNIWKIDFDIQKYYDCVMGEMNYIDIIKNLYSTFSDDWLEIIPAEKGSGHSIRYAVSIKSL